MPTEKTWQQWLERLYNLRRDKRGSHERPHKPVLLLAILDLLDRGQVKANEIALTPALVKTFRRYFAVVRRDDDQPSIENPFYFLAGDATTVMAAPVTTKPNFRAATPRPLFKLPRGTVDYAVTADGEHFLVCAPGEESTSGTFTIVMNWASGLEGR